MVALAACRTARTRFNVIFSHYELMIMKCRIPYCVLFACYVRFRLCKWKWCSINSDTKCLVMFSVKCVNDKRVIHLIVIYAHCLAANVESLHVNVKQRDTNTHTLSAVTLYSIRDPKCNKRHHPLVRARACHRNNSIDPILRWQLRYLVRHVVCIWKTYLLLYRAVSGRRRGTLVVLFSFIHPKQ